MQRGNTALEFRRKILKTSFKQRYDELVVEGIRVTGTTAVEALEYANKAISKEIKLKATAALEYPRDDYNRIRELRNQLVQERSIDVNDLNKNVVERNLAWADAIEMFKKEKGNDNTAA